MYAGKATNQYAYGNSMASKSFSVEKVAVFFPALSSPDEKTRSQGGKALREFIEEQSRERSPRSFDELIEKVRKKFAEMANSENNIKMDNNSCRVYAEARQNRKSSGLLQTQQL